LVGHVARIGIKSKMLQNVDGELTMKAANWKTEKRG